MTYPREIQMWECSDGERWPCVATAVYHQQQVAAAETANRLWREGHDLKSTLQAVGWWTEYLEQETPAGHRLTKDSRLVISHWQCSKEPAYRIVEFCASGRLHVFGNAVSWSNGYGENLSVAEVLRYAKTPGTVF